MSTHEYGAMVPLVLMDADECPLVLMGADECPWPHGAMLMAAPECS